MNKPTMDHKRYPWKVFAVLLSAGVFGVLAILPYLLAFIKKLPIEPPPSLPVLLLMQFLQGTILVGVAVGVGLLVAGKVGLGAPLLEDWLAGEKIAQRLKPLLQTSITAGVGVGVILLLLAVFVFIPLVPPLRIILAPDVAIWKKFLAAFYGGITEELLMRLFLFSLLTWLLSKVWPAEGTAARAGVLWSVNVIVAILFGLGHLPVASLLIPITPSVIVAALVLNGLAGITFGYLYWKHGLEAAIVAHFSTDIVLHVIRSALFR